jgi:hypothetical protein
MNSKSAKRIRLYSALLILSVIAIVAALALWGEEAELVVGLRSSVPRERVNAIRKYDSQLDPLQRRHSHLVIAALAHALADPDGDVCYWAALRGEFRKGPNGHRMGSSYH